MDSKEIIFRNLEEDVYKSISKCLSNEETLKFDQFFDFYVPNGVKKLGWGKGTYIEVKYRLMSSTILRLNQYFDRLRPKKLIVIVFDAGDIPFREGDIYDSKIQSRRIEFLSFEDLQKQVSALSIDSVTPEAGVTQQYQEEKEENNLSLAHIAIKNNKISLFLGAGVSASAGSVTWDVLLKKLSKKRGLNLKNGKRTISDIQKGRYIIDDYKGHSDVASKEFYDDFRSILYKGIKLGRKEGKKKRLIESIASLITNPKVDLESVITFNYDDLIEQEIASNPSKYKKGCVPIYEESVTVDRNSIYFYHVYGYVSENSTRSKEIILGEKEYHQVYRDTFNWSNVEQLHALNRSSCFFIGLSMIDPNLRRLMDISYKESDKDCQHFVFLKKDEYNKEYMENTMRSFGVNCIWYDNHDELPDILNSLI